jgi:RimJ/RimL family protein N-acetyltransferase
MDDHERIKGDQVSLRPLTESDRETFYRWATQSDGTPFWYGEKTGEEIPSRLAFFQDWKEHYFDGSQPLQGRSFAIVVNPSGREVGQINYQRDVEEKERMACDLDIIIARKNDQNRGYGNEALRLLTDYLSDRYGIQYFTIYTLPENRIAIRSFQKAGFSILGEHRDENGIVWTKLGLEK